MEENNPEQAKQGLDQMIPQAPGEKSQADIEPPAPSPTTGMQTSMMEETQRPSVEETKPVPTTAAPMPVIQQPTLPRSDREIEERIQELVEEIVEEKWHQLVENMSDITIWKDRVSTEILSIKQEIIRTENRFENLQKAILGKVSEYGKGMIDVSTEIKALEQVLQKIIQPLSSNVKELSRITKELKR